MNSYPSRSYGLIIIIGDDVLTWSTQSIKLVEFIIQRHALFLNKYVPPDSKCSL